MLKSKLQNGIEIPRLGFGVFQMNEASQCEAAVSSALETGYRLLDTASAYENEESVGNAIRNSGIPRSEIFITTKLWVQDMGYEKTKNAFYRSLDRLKSDYLDLYLIHQPYSDVYGAWRAMEDLYEEGVVKAIGVSNFSPARLIDLITFNRIPPVLNQVETHPFCQQIANAELMKRHGVQIESWAPFAEGKNDIFHNPTLLSIAGEYGKSVAQVILRWLLQRDVVVIPKSVNPERIKQNFAVFDFELDEASMTQIAALDEGRPLIVDHDDPERVKLIGTRIFRT